MKYSKPQISVVIPVHDRAHTIRRAIDSVLAQELLPDEIIVVDDGSTDKTPDILASYLPKIQVVRQGNRGVSAARNRGVAQANEKWIAFLDSDDEWMYDKLQKQMSYIEQHPNIRILQTEERWIRNNMRVNPGKKYVKKSGNIFKNCLKTCIVGPSTVICEAKLLSEMGGFDEKLPVCEDYDLWLRIAAKYPIPLLSEALIIKYGGHPDQLSLSIPGMDRYRVQSLEKILQEEPLSGTQKHELLDELIIKLGYLYEGAVRRRKDTDIYLRKLMDYRDIKISMQ
ncbi:MAG: glycosyltransferase family 2 protein [Candidatus Marinimicrobia bacterium]|nr:glycosyltransferase family 2 protein [Candidatus Neomarinimicrobiota bacterium]